VYAITVYSVFFQRVTSFLLQRFRFGDHWQCRKVPLQSWCSNRRFQLPDVARDPTVAFFFFMFFMFCLVVQPFWQQLPMPLPLLPLFMQLPPLPLRLLSLALRNWLFLTLLFLDLAMTMSLLFSKPHRSPPPRCLGPLHSSGYSTRVHPICTMPLTRSLGSLPGCFGGSVRSPSLPTLATLDSFRHVANLLVLACHPHNLKCSISPPVVVMRDDNSF
jgi:hypothetical protein